MLLFPNIKGNNIEDIIKYVNNNNKIEYILEEYLRGQDGEKQIDMTIDGTQTGEYPVYVPLRKRRFFRRCFLYQALSAGGVSAQYYPAIQ